MKKRFVRYLPLEVQLPDMVTVLLVCLGATLLLSLHFFADYAEAYSWLFQTVHGKPVLRDGAMMQPFFQLSWWTWMGPAVALPAMAGVAVSFYSIHNRESRSSYLMRRLPNRWEYHRRCLAAPLAIAIATVLFALALQGIYYLVYLLRTPAICLP